MTHPIRALIQSILKKWPHASPIGIHVHEPLDEPLTADVDGVDVVYCPGMLAFREELVRPRDRAVALVTPMHDGELGLDVRARLWRSRLFRIERWRLVCQILEVDGIDPRIVGQNWMADALILAQSRVQAVPRNPSRNLDEDTAWTLLCRSLLGFPAKPVDAIGWLTWAHEQGSQAAFQARGPEFREGLSDWLAGKIGDVAHAMIHAMNSASGEQLGPLGLVCGVLFGQGTPTKGELSAAVVRFQERFLGRERLSVAQGRHWAAAAQAAMSSAERGNHWPRQAQTLLEQLEIEAFAYHSDVLPVGYEQRLDRLARAITQALSKRPWNLDSLEDRFEDLARHQQAQAAKQSFSQAEMALRAMRFLCDPPRRSAEFFELCDAFMEHGGHLDWVRRVLAVGHAQPMVQHAYDQILARLNRFRDAQNQAFARQLQSTMSGLKSRASFLLMEDVLEQVIGQIPNHSLMWLIMDGMSLGDFQELMGSVAQMGLVPIVPVNQTKPYSVLSTVPSITECARMSLLTGALGSGHAAEERRAFENHPILSNLCGSHKPMLVHKGELTSSDGRGLNPEVRAHLEQGNPRVIAVVLNTIDDHLAKSDQVIMSWNLDAIPLLQQLLVAARAGKRWVIMTSDHGHVLEQGSQLRKADHGGDRYRANEGALQDGEFLFQGTRVLGLEGCVVAAGTEGIRYGHKKQGYHGGVTLQEMLVPLAVISPTEPDRDKGWEPAHMENPAWWDKPQMAMQWHSTPDPPSVKKAPREVQVSLFDSLDTQETERETKHWIQPFLQSETFQSQYQSHSRARPSMEHVTCILETLDAHGGAALLTTLGKAIDQPGRISGIVSTLCRIINVDEYPILSVDPQSRTVTLNQPLLRTQYLKE